MSVVKLIELVIQDYKNEKDMFKKMVNIFQPLFKNIPFIPQLINAMLEVIYKNKYALFNYIPTIIMLGMVIFNYIKHIAKDKEEKDKKKEKEGEKKEGEGEGE